jgi:alpha-L-fucosidase
MLNIALKGDGTLPQDQEKLLKGFGKWVQINKEAIYGTTPWKVFGEGPTEILSRRTGENLKAFTEQDIRFTKKENKLYAFILARPQKDILIQSLKKSGLLQSRISSISLLGSDENIKWDQSESELKIKLPKDIPSQPVIAFEIELKSK